MSESKEGRRLVDEYCGRASQPAADALSDAVEQNNDWKAIALVKAERFSEAEARVIITQLRSDLQEDRAKYPKLVSIDEIGLILSRTGAANFGDVFKLLEEPDAPRAVGRHNGSLLYKHTDVQNWLRGFKGRG